MIDKQNLYCDPGEITLDGADYEFVEAHFHRKKPGVAESGELSLVFRHRKSNECVCLKFIGTRLENCLEFSDGDRLQIINEHWRGYEGREQIAAWLFAEDGDKDRMFGAARME